MKLSKEQTRELTTAITYYINFLKASIWNEDDRTRKKQLQERLFIANKLYFLFEHGVRITPKFGFNQDWKRFSEKILNEKLLFN